MVACVLLFAPDWPSAKISESAMSTRPSRRTSRRVLILMYGVTVTPYVKINPRLLVRLEGRVDLADSDYFADGQGGKKSSSQATVALNAAFTY